MLHGISICVVSLVLAGCAGGKDPGPLAGTWQATKPFPVTVTFRQGETEALGLVRAVEYDVDGNEVRVTYAEGANKGATFKYEVVDDDTLRSGSGTFRRVRR